MESTKFTSAFEVKSSIASVLESEIAGNFHHSERSSELWMLAG